ncbi:MAG: FGGY-family carbohydrate kinase, partial [Agromyces sp.]
EAAELAASVPDNGGVYFVPAFSGLFAPYWRPDARGALVGLTRFADKRHIARAAIEATAFQTADVVDAVAADTGVPLSELRVDGGMAANAQLMQFQADLLRIPVVRPIVTETTALGAATAAGLAAGVWKSQAELRSLWREDQRWVPQLPLEERDRLLRQWKKAVSKSMDWVDSDTR